MDIKHRIKHKSKRNIKRQIRRLNDDKGISIILAIIIIIVLGLAGSIFAYLMSSGSINSRADLLSAEAKYAAKSGVELTLYELEQTPQNFTPTAPSEAGCPTSPVMPPGVTGTISGTEYLSGNLQGNLPKSVNYTPTFCAMVTKFTPKPTPTNCGTPAPPYYIINSNGFAGGTEREITAEVIVGGTNTVNNNSCTGIYVETELPNSYK